MEGLHVLTIGKLALNLTRTETPETRAHMRRQVLAVLDQADLTPDGLPPRAILVVRRITDPAPDALFEGDAPQAARGWGKHMRAALGELWRGAARPAREPVPAGAQAVWFADRAEWLACLSLDLYFGIAAARWWWWAVLPHGVPSDRDAIGALWIREIEALPAALALIAQANPRVLMNLVQNLQDNTCESLVNSITMYYNVINHRGKNTQFVLLQRLIRLLPSFSQILTAELFTPNSANRVHTPPHFTVVILALAVFYAPEQTRAVCREIADDIEARRTDEHRPAHSLSHMPMLPDETHRAPVDDAPVPDVFDGAVHANPSAETDWPTPVRDIPDEVFHTADASTSPPFEIDNEAPFTLLTEPERDPREPIRTGFGGVFYLVTALEALSLTEADDAISPWAMLAGLAAHFLGDLPPDPLWGALLTLTGDESAALESLDAWCALHSEQVRAWYGERLADPERFNEIMRQPAAVFITATHIDVYFSLHQIDLEMRVNGLDRDPGWLPAWGRVILLHYV